MQEADHQQRLAEAEARELVAREFRLQEAERLIEIENERILAVAEARAKLHEEHAEGKERRRKQSIVRKASLQKAEEAARAEVTAKIQDSESRLAERQISNERTRQERKARLAAMLSKVKGVDTLGVAKC